MLKTWWNFVFLIKRVSSSICPWLPKNLILIVPQMDCRQEENCPQVSVHQIRLPSKHTRRRRVLQKHHVSAHLRGVLFPQLYRQLLQAICARTFAHRRWIRRAAKRRPQAATHRQLRNHRNPSHPGHGLAAAGVELIPRMTFVTCR